MAFNYEFKLCCHFHKMHGVRCLLENGTDSSSTPYGNESTLKLSMMPIQVMV